MSVSNYVTDRLKNIIAFTLAIGVIGVIILVVYGGGYGFVYYVWLPTHEPSIIVDEFGVYAPYDNRYATGWGVYLGTLCVSGIIIIDYQEFKAKNKEGTQ